MRPGPAARRGAVTPDVELVRVLDTLGGVATRGDLIMATALPLETVQAALDHLMAGDRVEVTVSESGVMTYRIPRPKGAPPASGSESDGEPPPGRARWLPEPPRARPPRRRHAGVAADRHPVRSFDRKTLALIRARGGVVSLAELVEHTGLPVSEARTEALRLAALYGGEPHASWDGHVVYAFPGLVESAHGAFHVREPRPAWARAQDPMEEPPASWWTEHPVLTGLAAVATGLLVWAASVPPPGDGRAVVLAAVAGASAGTAFAVSAGLLRRLARHPRLRLRRPETLRRYALGYVFETALKGKGVVSLSRTLAYLRSRTGARWLPRSRVEAALRGLAVEFDAPVTELDGELFFGFRNVKRQFLASQVKRQELALERKAGGRTVYASGDSALDAAARELEDFDRALRDPRPGSET